MVFCGRAARRRCVVMPKPQKANTPMVKGFFRFFQGSWLRCSWYDAHKLAWMKLEFTRIAEAEKDFQHCRKMVDDAVRQAGYLMRRGCCLKLYTSKFVNHAATLKFTTDQACHILP